MIGSLAHFARFFTEGQGLLLGLGVAVMAALAAIAVFSGWPSVEISVRTHLEPIDVEAERLRRQHVDETFAAAHPQFKHNVVSMHDRRRSSS